MGPSPIGSTLRDATYIAVALQDVLYGVELVLYFETIHAVITLEKKRRADALLVLFSTVSLILAAVSVSTNTMFSVEVCKLQPSGAGTTARYLAFGRGAMFILQLMSDGLLIHRCWVIWDNARIIIVPLILWIATLILGVVQSWMISADAVFLPTVPALVALGYFIACVLLNVTLTVLICYRIIRHGNLVRASLGDEHSSVYFTLAEIIVQSALLYTLSGIPFVVALGFRSHTTITFQLVYMMMMCISPQMLILRVLKTKPRRKDSSEPTTSVSNIRFQNLSEVPSRGDDDPEVGLHLRPLSKAY